MMKKQIIFLCMIFGVSFGRADFPAIDESLGQNDFAVATQGQLKHVALWWARQLTFSDLGVSDDILNLVGGFTDQDNNAVVNLGQLKAVAAPFYDHIRNYSRGGLPDKGDWAGPYPWSFPSAAPNDFAVANIGQIKYLFNFKLDSYLNPDAAAKITGQVFYDGAQSGTIHVMALVNPFRHSRLFEDQQNTPGAFVLNVSSHQGYYLFAYMDSDGNGIGNDNEPWGTLACSPIAAGSQKNALVLKDASGDQWTKLHRFGSVLINEQDDEDGDGLSNIEEVNEGTNWLNPDSDGDGLSDGDELSASGTWPDTDGVQTDPLGSDTDNDGISDGARKELDDSITEHPLGAGVLIKIPDRGLYHAAETNLNLVPLGGH